MARFAHVFAPLLAAHEDQLAEIPGGAELADSCFSTDWTLDEFNIFLNYLRLCEARTIRPAFNDGVSRLVDIIRSEMARDPSRGHVRLLFARALLAAERRDDGLAHLRKLMMSRFTVASQASQLFEAVFEGRETCS